MNLLICSIFRVYSTRIYHIHSPDIPYSINLYCLDLILHLQGKVLQYLASQHLHLYFIVGDKWVAVQWAYPSSVINV